jgi:hypothetical protein
VYASASLETVYVADDPARADAARLLAALARGGLLGAGRRPG